jgi:subtilisin family serine protease
MTETIIIPENIGFGILPAYGGAARLPARPTAAPMGMIVFRPTAQQKNILTVGAVNDLATGYNPNGSASQVEMSTFSGWGPTDDGRIKPDLVANGISLYSSTAESNTAYGSLNGTSMSTPSVTGSMALIDQHVSNLFPGTALRASAMKALLLHTADECGTAPGPDYRFGWGLMNTQKATEVLSNLGGRHLVVSRDSLNNGDVRERTFYHDGVGGFKVTIAWTDPAGAVSASTLNSTARKLVNDLDLRIISQATAINTFPGVSIRLIRGLLPHKPTMTGIT